jgi:hypothetical protein
LPAQADNKELTVGDAQLHLLDHLHRISSVWVGEIRNTEQFCA